MRDSHPLRKEGVVSAGRLRGQDSLPKIEIWGNGLTSSWIVCEDVVSKDSAATL